jgi:hypothetical protein
MCVSDGIMQVSINGNIPDVCTTKQVCLTLKGLGHQIDSTFDDVNAYFH